MNPRIHGTALLAAALGLAACGPAPQPATTPDDAAPGPAPAGAQAEAQVRSQFRCGDLLVGALFDNAAQTLTLSLSGRRLQLPQAISASGARYADTSGNEFWNKGSTAMFTLDGTLQPECVETDEVSAWDQARDRGVVFRGLGTEPGWQVEVQGGDAPALHAQLDYGERRLDVVAARPLADEAGYAGTTADGAVVTLRIAKGACSDGMSDQTYPASVQLQVDDRHYQGCGAWLRD